MVSDVDDSTLDALTRFGMHLGMCFQVVDDVLDLTATDEALGKHAGQDLLEGVYTLPVIYALRDDATLRDRLGRPLDADEVAEATSIATANGSVDAALVIARGHATKAIDALEGADALDPRVCGALTSPRRDPGHALDLNLDRSPLCGRSLFEQSACDSSGSSLPHLRCVESEPSTSAENGGSVLSTFPEW